MIQLAVVLARKEDTDVRKILDLQVDLEGREDLILAALLDTVARLRRIGTRVRRDR